MSTGTEIVSGFYNCYFALSARRKPAKIVKFSVIRSSWKKTKNVSESMGLFHKQVIPLIT